MLDYDNINPKNIWEIEQNKPSLIATDFSYLGIPRHITHKILLGRGVYKWFSVRRKLIKLKVIWKDRVNQTLLSIRNIKQDYKQHDAYTLGYLRGYLKATEECRKEVRFLCHSDRWQAPDFDEESVTCLHNHE